MWPTRSWTNAESPEPGASRQALRQSPSGSLGQKKNCLRCSQGYGRGMEQGDA